jgi:MFS family permease
MAQIAVVERESRGPSVLDRERTIAGPGFNRWLAPPAALAIHLCIGMAYGFSVFWLPMSTLLPGAPSCAGQGFFAELTSQSCNWTVPSVTHIFETFIAMLGISAAIWGGWLERAGPRKAGFIAALCWGGGLALGGVGVWVHQLWLVYLGCGLVGGIGQGLGYITPVSTLIKWFPDRRGMATGFAIMGYGGGAMIGSPLAVWLMARTSAHGVAGVAATLMILGAIYFTAMASGAFGIRVAPSGWRPAGWSPPAAKAGGRAMISTHSVHVSQAWKTPQFWLIWAVLCLNVTAGISVISMASPMFQDVFGGRLLAADPLQVAGVQKAAIAAAAAGLVGLVSLFNSLGRIFWASVSDFLGRKNTYYVFFIAGLALYGLLPTWGHLGVPVLFVASVCIILTMYGGGFATLPAYLADIFGVQMVGAIHGRLITAWSVAGIIGPTLITSLRESQLKNGVPNNLVYDSTLYTMAVLLFFGLLCNSFVRPVNPRHYMSDEEIAHERALQHESGVAEDAQTAARGRLGLLGVGGWAAVGVPFAIGLLIALRSATALI